MDERIIALKSRFSLTDEACAAIASLVREVRSDAIGDALTLHRGGERRAPAAPGPEMERYEDLGRIGRGGMGEVRRVRDRTMDRVLAMKTLPFDMLDSPRDRERFLAEVRITAALQHPGIVPIHDCGELPDGRLWFTMKEIRGTTLHEVIAELHRGAPAYSLRRVLDAFHRICEAVAYSHSRGVVHRDLKPANLMIGEFGEVLVLDWGIARRMPGAHTAHGRSASERGGADAAITRDGEILGTLAYMPPEQAMGEIDRLGPASDVYALGAVLYEILAGKPPFTGSLGALYRQILAGGPPPLASVRGVRFEIPAELSAICETAMRRSPEDRFADAGALADQVRAWLDDMGRRDRGLAIVARANAAAPRLGEIERRARGLREEAHALLGPMKPFTPAAEKAKGWALEEQAAALEHDLAVEEETWLQTLRSALNEAPDLAEAHAALADHYWGRVVAAEGARDERGAARAETLLRAHDRGWHASFLAGNGAITLVTAPPAARVLLHRYVERSRRLVPDLVRDLGPTPILDVPVERGSYVLRVEAAGYRDTLYPVLIGRGERWDGVRPGGEEPAPIRLLREAEIGPDSVYVPAGWFIAGGDPEAIESLPRARVWVDGMIVRRDPITNREYLLFLNALVAANREAEAISACPRFALGRGRPGDNDPVFVRDGHGRFHLAPSAASEEEELSWPVAFVDWHAAMAYARWIAAETGQPWRLLNELEWEKAARGVDGRFMPWGDFPEPTWAAMVGSHGGVPSRMPVDRFATDESPYGVRGMAGNVRDMCINVWKQGGPEIRDGIVLLDAAADGDPDLRAARGGAWSTTLLRCRMAGRFAASPSERFGGMGFRLARSLDG